MQGDKHNACARKIELLLLTREEDFKEISGKLAEMQKLLGGRLDALTLRLAAIEESLARARHNPRCLST